MPYFIYKDKDIFYDDIGSGSPLLLLHGNTASSKLFDDVIDLYRKDFKVILIDFLGHGKSDRLDSFPVDFWYDQAKQAAALIKHNNYKKVNIIGTSGGALAALNIALEYGDLVNKVIADSFEGEKALDIVAEIIQNDRNHSKSNQSTVDFWYHNHGSDWEDVVDNDTDVMLRHHKLIGNFFHKDLSSLKLPVMLTVSLEDEFAEFVDFKLVYEQLGNKMDNSKLHFFQTGGHPAMLTNAKEFSDIAKKFFKGNS